jgi:hypothetical protein
VRIWISGSVPLTNGSESGYNSRSGFTSGSGITTGSGITSGSDSFLAKNYFFIFFTYNLPACTSSSVLKFIFFDKNFMLKFILHGLFQSSQHLYEKREGSGAGSRSIPLTNGFGRPENMGILRIRIPNTAAG